MAALPYYPAERKGNAGMEGLENIIYLLDDVLDTRRKRHISGGILLSISLLLGGLAMTVITIKNEEEDDDE